MIKSEFCTLRVLNLRDNFIKLKEAEKILEALKRNKTIIKLPLDYNPVKQSLLHQIHLVCSRNYNLDSINQKSKNVYTLAQKKRRGITEK
jgi:Ran GTPase-activating protein (RanGAP) involved in mRNA processing and transport